MAGENHDDVQRVLASNEIFPVFQRLLETASSEVILVSPFINYSLFKQCLESVPTGVPLTLITTWRLEDLVSGFNDLGIKTLLETRENSTLKLLWNLHAKYYRIDSTVLVGSGNLTHRGLNAGGVGNSEVMLRVDQNFAGMGKYEQHLVDQSVFPDEEYFQELLKKIEALKLQRAEESRVPQVSPIVQLNDKWKPYCEMPNLLFGVYEKDTRAIDQQMIALAKSDLLYIDAAEGMNRDGFNLHVRNVLAQSALFAEVISKLRSSGGITSEEGYRIVKAIFPEISKDDALQIWSATQRWLRFFYPEQFLLRRKLKQ
jgi:hypothetical protein